jgi:hypothetical protein
VSGIGRPSQPEAAGPVPAPRPLDLPMVPFWFGGMAVWLVALLVVLPFRDTHEDWFWICVAGFLWGFPALPVMIRHDANRRRRRAAASP